MLPKRMDSEKKVQRLYRSEIRVQGKAGGPPLRAQIR